MVDPSKLDKGHEHCAVDLKCEGCPYRETDEATTCIVNLLDDMKEYIMDLEAAKVERDALAEEFQKIMQERQWIRAEDEKPPYNTYVKVWLQTGGSLSRYIPTAKSGLRNTF